MRSTKRFQHGWHIGCMHPWRNTASGKPSGCGSAKWQSMQMFGCAVCGCAALQVEVGEVYDGALKMGFSVRGSGTGKGCMKRNGGSGGGVGPSFDASTTSYSKR